MGNVSRKKLYFLMELFEKMEDHDEHLNEKN